MSHLFWTFETPPEFEGELEQEPYKPRQRGYAALGGGAATPIYLAGLLGLGHTPGSYLEEYEDILPIPGSPAFEQFKKGQSEGLEYANPENVKESLAKGLGAERKPEGFYQKTYEDILQSVGSTWGLGGKANLVGAALQPLGRNVAKEAGASDWASELIGVGAGIGGPLSGQLLRGTSKIAATRNAPLKAAGETLTKHGVGTTSQLESPGGFRDLLSRAFSRLKGKSAREPVEKRFGEVLDKILDEAGPVTTESLEDASTALAERVRQNVIERGEEAKQLYKSALETLPKGKMVDASGMRKALESAQEKVKLFTGESSNPVWNKLHQGLEDLISHLPQGSLTPGQLVASRQAFNRLKASIREAGSSLEGEVTKEARQALHNLDEFLAENTRAFKNLGHEGEQFLQANQIYERAHGSTTNFENLNGEKLRSRLANPRSSEKMQEELRLLGVPDAEIALMKRAAADDIFSRTGIIKDGNVNLKNLGKVLSQESNREKLTVLLGKDHVNDLRKLAHAAEALPQGDAMSRRLTEHLSGPALIASHYLLGSVHPGYLAAAYAGIRGWRFIKDAASVAKSKEFLDAVKAQKWNQANRVAESLINAQETEFEGEITEDGTSSQEEFEGEIT